MKRVIVGSIQHPEYRIDYRSFVDMLKRSSRIAAHKVNSQSSKLLTCYTVAGDPAYYQLAKLNETTISSIRQNNIVVVSYDSTASLEEEINASGVASEDSLALHKINRVQDNWSNIYQLLILMDIYFVCEVDQSGVVTRLFELNGQAIMEEDNITVQDYFDDLSRDEDDAIHEIEINYGTGDMPDELLHRSLDQVIRLFKNYRKSK